MAKNTNLHAAKDAKNDEFYTQIADIENELRHYKKHFKDKVIYCNNQQENYKNPNYIHCIILIEREETKTEVKPNVCSYNEKLINKRLKLLDEELKKSKNSNSMKLLFDNVTALNTSYVWKSCEYIEMPIEDNIIIEKERFYLYGVKSVKVIFVSNESRRNEEVIKDFPLTKNVEIAKNAAMQL